MSKITSPAQTSGASLIANTWQGVLQTNDPIEAKKRQVQCTNHNLLTIHQNYIWIRKSELSQSYSASISSKNMDDIIVTYGFLIFVMIDLPFFEKIEIF